MGDESDGEVDDGDNAGFWVVVEVAGRAFVVVVVELPSI